MSLFFFFIYHVKQQKGLYVMQHLYEQQGGFKQYAINEQHNITWNTFSDKFVSEISQDSQ